MPTNIDDKELARLEYLIEASESCGYSTQSDDPNMQYLAAACHYTPALVAEVRRLRAELDVYIEEDQIIIITLQRNIIEILREKVEAWEWWDEVADLNEDTFWCSFLSRSAANEMCDTYLAAREAIC